VRASVLGRGRHRRNTYPYFAFIFEQAGSGLRLDADCIEGPSGSLDLFAGLHVNVDRERLAAVTEREAVRFALL